MAYYSNVYISVCVSVVEAVFDLRNKMAVLLLSKQGCFRRSRTGLRTLILLCSVSDPSVCTKVCWEE